ncbi:Purine-binding protein [bioreactor metagenome]|uniref:Purine-binding protein n=1 Tax=bioreactor metagenome TaxID=1076179 RepID=A0A645H1P6_9ZZZZ
MGIKCIGINASSPAIPQTCETAGVLCTGYHVDMKAYAPKAVMVSYMWNWAPIFEDIISNYANTGKPSETSYYWGAEKDCSTISDINTDIVPADVAAKVEEVKAKIASGELDVLAGEIKDNNGNVIVEKGSTMNDEVNRSMDFLVDNIIGQLP